MRNARSGMPGNGIVPRLPAVADRGRKGSGTALETDESSRDTAVVTDLVPVPGILVGSPASFSS